MPGGLSSISSNFLGSPGDVPFQMSEFVADRPSPLRWLERFERREGRRLRRLAWQLLGPDGEDATQEVYQRLASLDESLATAEDVNAFLWTAARRDLIDIHRRRCRRAVECPLDESIDERVLATYRDSPFQRASENERRERLRQEIARLPAIYREVLVLRDFEQLRYQEMSELLGVPLGTIKSRVAAATAELARKLQNWRQS